MNPQNFCNIFVFVTNLCIIVTMIKHTSILLVLAIGLLGSCRTPQEKLTRLYKKYPELTKSDTNYIYKERIITDTVVIAGDTVVLTKKDTIYDTKELRVVVTKDSIKVIKKPVMVTIHDTIKDSIPIVHINNIPIIKEKEVISDWVRMLIGCLSITVLTLLIVIKIKK